MDERLRGRGVDLRSKVQNVRVYGSARHVAADTPDEIEQFVPREEPSRRPEQSRNQVELALR
jgi:hypothetical protein